ncbi:hypothetical protein HDV00_000197 [Rhizophlyctis rosea]|nr:hypothetical protein HDV00_000197 [Rhizophlyctis rosea]
MTDSHPLTLTPVRPRYDAASNPTHLVTPSRAGGLVAATPFGHDSVSLKKQLREAQRLIQEKDRELQQKDEDLKLAAELGFQLMANNENLKNEYERVLAEYQAATLSNPSRSPSVAEGPSDDTMHALAAKRADASTAARIADLECAILDLQTKNDNLKTDLRIAQESERSYASRIKRLEVEVASTKEDLDLSLSHTQQLEDEKRRLQKDKTELSRRIKEANEGPKSDDSEAVETLREQLHTLEEMVIALHQDRAELESAANDAIAERSELESRCQELDALIESQREESTSQSAQIDALSWDLESSRDLITKLQHRLSVLEPTRDGAPDSGDKTLLSEIEDRRKELEERHLTLASRHAGLVKAHSMSVHQQERMRNHITRLAQLGGSGGGKAVEQRVRMLEVALGQSESENRELLGRIEVLEKERREGYFGGVGGVEGGRLGGGSGGSRKTSAELDHDYEVEMEALRIRVDQLTSETENLRKELKTARMVGKYESEKLRLAEGGLREAEEEGRRLRQANAQLKFEFDELRLKLKRAEEGDGHNEDDIREPVVVGAGKRGKQMGGVKVNVGTQTEKEERLCVGITQATQTEPDGEEIIHHEEDRDVSLSNDINHSQFSEDASSFYVDQQSVDLGEVSDNFIEGLHGGGADVSRRSDVGAREELIPVDDDTHTPAATRNSVRASLSRGGRASSGGKQRQGQDGRPAQVFVGRSNVKSEECKQQ